MRLRSSADNDRPRSTVAALEDGAQPLDVKVHPLLVTALDTESKYAQNVSTIRSKIMQQRGDSQSIAHYALLGFDCPEELGVLAVNLAVAMSRMETPTLLVEAARSGAMAHHLLDVPNEVGFANFDATAPLSDIAHPTAVPQLWLVPAGPAPADDNLMIEKQPIVERLDRWNVRSSVVLISRLVDNRSSQATSADMMKGVDGAILVLRRHKTRISDVQAFVDLLDERGIPAFASVIV